MDKKILLTGIIVTSLLLVSGASAKDFIIENSGGTDLFTVNGTTNNIILNGQRLCADGTCNDFIQGSTASFSSINSGSGGEIDIQDNIELNGNPIDDNDGSITFQKGGSFSGNLNLNGNTLQSVNSMNTQQISRITPIYIRGTGLNNDANRLVKIGGTVVANNGCRGLQLTIVRKSDHAVTHNQCYDTYGTASDTTALGNRLYQMANGQIGILTSYDAWESAVDSNLDANFTRLGLYKAAQAPNSGSRRPYASIFESSSNGASSAKSTEVLLDRSSSQPHAQIRGFLIEGSYLVEGGKASNLAGNQGKNPAVLTDGAQNVRIPNGNLDLDNNALNDVDWASSDNPNTDTQDLSISGDTISLTNGGSVTISDAVEDTQTLSETLGDGNSAGTSNINMNQNDLNNVRTIEVDDGSENAILFDAGQARFTTHDGNGNFQLLQGADGNNNCVGSDRGAVEIEMDEDGWMEVNSDADCSDNTYNPHRKMILRAGSGDIDFYDRLDMNSGTITGLNSPSASSDAATKGYVDGQDHTDDQSLGTSGNQITLTNGGSVTAPYANNADKVDGRHLSDFADQRYTWYLGSGSGSEVFKIGELQGRNTRFHASIVGAQDQGSNSARGVEIYGWKRDDNAGARHYRIGGNNQDVNLILTETSNDTNSDGYNDTYVYVNAQDFTNAKLILEKTGSFTPTFTSGLTSTDIVGTEVYRSNGEGSADMHVGSVDVGGGTLSDVGDIVDNSGTNCGGNQYLDGNGNCQTDTDTQDLGYDSANDVISLTNGGSIDISEVDTNTDTQDLSISGDTISLTNGGSVTINDAVEDTQSLSETLGDGNSAGGTAITDVGGQSITGTVSTLAKNSELYLASADPQIEFEDTGVGNSGRYWIHNNGGRLYFLQDRNNDGGWNSPHPMTILSNGNLQVGNNLDMSNGQVLNVGNGNFDMVYDSGQTRGEIRSNGNIPICIGNC